jgi:GTP cyclohydrolase I
MSELQHPKYLNFDPNKITEKDRDKIIENAAKAYGLFLTELGITDWEKDPHTKDTPKRVAKSFVNDLFEGLYNPAPNITTFENTDGYTGVVFDGNITVNSMCAHHHLSFFGNAYVAYIPSKNGKIIGLSKLNRVVEFFSRRPQVQENLTTQIHDYLNEIIEGNGGIAVAIECSHLCSCVRGVKHNSKMLTSKLSGAFMDNNAARQEFYDFIKLLK